MLVGDEIRWDAGMALIRTVRAGSHCTTRFLSGSEKRVKVRFGLICAAAIITDTSTWTALYQYEIRGELAGAARRAWECKSTSPPRSQPHPR